MDAFTLLLRQGAGSYAIVWKARRRADGRIVAIKQVPARVGVGWECCRRCCGTALQTTATCATRPCASQLKSVGLSWEEVLALPEIAHWKDLRHPHVLGLDSVVRLRGVTYLVMEFCDANLYQVRACVW
jgi:serine/threonine protein kinase